MAEEASRLLWDWINEKNSVEAFLTNPIEWVADELDKACASIPLNRPLRREDLETIKTLTDIIRFIDRHRNLVPIR
jgi:hypothetical protein